MASTATSSVAPPAVERADVGTGQKLGQRDRQGEHITRPIQAMLHTGCGGIKTKQTLKFSLSNK